MDMKSIKVVWLIALGSDRNRRLLTSDNMDESCPAAGVFPTGVPWATGPSTTAGPSTARFWWCAGPAKPAGSSSSSAGPSLADCWLAGSATSSGSSMMSGSSGIHDHDGSPCWPVTCWPVICWAVICWAVTCRVLICRAVTCWAVHSLCRTRHSCWVIHFSCRLFNVFWLGRQRNHRDGSSLWWLGNGWGQLYLPSGDVGWTRPLSTFTSFVLMMTRQTLAICWRPRWWWRQGPTITRWLAMMVMGMRGRPWRPDIRRPRSDMARPRTTRRISLPPGAGPTPSMTWARPAPSQHPLSCLEEWWDLGESWCLSDPCDRQLRSPLRDLWRSDS